MKELTCYGFGHRENHYSQDNLERIIVNLIKEKGVTTFYTGGMGNFDSAFSAAVRNAKKTFINIKLCLIAPYLTKTLVNNKNYYNAVYDEVLIPDIKTYYKSAITLRNRWIIDQSNYVVSGIIKPFGGAYNAIKYAQKKNKNIIAI